MAQELPLPPAVAVLLMGRLPEQGCEERRRPHAKPPPPPQQLRGGGGGSHTRRPLERSNREVGGAPSRDTPTSLWRRGGASATASASARDVR